MGLAENIRAARQARGMTQQELADRLDLTPNAVTMWESGRSKPRTAMMPLLAEILGTTTGELLGEDAGLRSGVRMPLYGWTHAGEPMEEIAGDGYAYVPPVVAERHPRGFLLRVRGARSRRCSRRPSARGSWGRTWRGAGSTSRRSRCPSRATGATRSPRSRARGASGPRRSCWRPCRSCAATPSRGAGSAWWALACAARRRWRSRGAFYTPLTCGYAPNRDSYPKRETPPTRRRGAHARPCPCRWCPRGSVRPRWSATGRARRRVKGGKPPPLSARTCPCSRSSAAP